MTKTKRPAKTLADALDTLRLLADETPDSPEKRAAVDVARTALYALGDLSGASNVRPPIEDVRRAHSVLFGGHPDRPDSGAYRRLVHVLRLARAWAKQDLSKAQRMYLLETGPFDPDLFAGAPNDPEFLRRRLAAIDPPLAEVDVLRLLDRLRGKGGLTGIAADLLLETRALGQSRRITTRTKPKDDAERKAAAAQLESDRRADRKRVQNIVNEAVKRGPRARRTNDGPR